MSDQLTEAELAALLEELGPTDSRDVVLEEHRQLEKDLLRLADPLPPTDFVQRVMARVEAAPARQMSRAEMLTGLGIVGSTLTLALTLFALGGAARLGSAFAQFAVVVREAVVAMGSALAALWQTAAVPMVAALGMMLFFSLVALRRLSAPPALKVVS